MHLPVMPTAVSQDRNTRYTKATGTPFMMELGSSRKVRSLLHCSALCTQEMPKCLSYAYNSGTSMCTLGKFLVNGGFVCLVGFLTSSSTTRLYRRRAPRQSVWQFYVLPHMRQSWETVTSVSAGHIMLTPTKPVASGRPQRESNPGPPHQESRALPTELYGQRRLVPFKLGGAKWFTRRPINNQNQAKSTIMLATCFAESKHE